MSERHDGVRRVAEFVHFRGCFSLKSRAAPMIDVLNESVAAERVLQGPAPAVVWLDTQAEALFLTERWGPDVMKQRLPLQLDVFTLTQPQITSDKELLVATIAFLDRQSLELFIKLGQQILPAWLSIRQGVLGRSLIITNGHWLVSYLGKAVRLQSSSLNCTGLIQLNLHKPSIEVVMQQGVEPSRLEAVGSLQAATKALHKHSCQKQHYDARVLHNIRNLQPAAASVQKLQGQLQASIGLKKGAPIMLSWISSGIMAALVDTATSLAEHILQQQQLTSKQWSGGGACSSLQAVLQGLADCVHIVYKNAGQHAEQQAQMFFDCVARSLGSSTTVQALMVATLLKLVIRALDDDNTDMRVQDHLQNASQDPLLLQQMLWCYSRAMVANQQTLLQTGKVALQLPDSQRHQQQQQCQPYDKVLELFPSGDTARSGPYSHPLVLLSMSQPCYDDSCLEAATARCQQAEPHSSPKRPVVPRLSLPSAGPGTPCVVGRSSRLSRRASDVNSLATPGSTLQPAANSALSALQQLGHNCGESVMASDLAAFVTHKQLHLGQAVVTQQGRRALSHSVPGASSGDLCGTQQAPAPTTEEITRLPQALQLQLALLDCIDMLTRQSAAASLPAAVDNVLLQQLLLPRALLLHWLHYDDVLTHAGLLHKALDWQRHVALKVVVRCHEIKRARQLARCSRDDDTRDTGPRLHNSLLAQFKQRLMDYCSIKRPDASVHEACRETLLLLKDYLRQVSRPNLVDLTCSIVGRALGQQEYMLRSSRVALWSWAAVRHMDALVQLYCEVVKKASSATAVEFLLQTLGSQQAASTISSSGHSSGGGVAPGVAPADTLQLVLEYLQQRLPAVHIAAARSGRDSGRPTSSRTHTAHSSAASPAPAGTPQDAHSRSPRCISTPGKCIAPPSVSVTCDTARSPLAGVPEHSAAADEVAGGHMTEASLYRRHCWQLLTALLELASRQEHGTLGLPAPNHISWGGSSSPAHTSITGLQNCALGKLSCEESSYQRALLQPATVKKNAAAATSSVSNADSTRSSEADQQPEQLQQHQQQQPISPKKLQQLPQQASAGDLCATQPETAWMSQVSSHGQVSSLGVTLLTSSSSSNHLTMPRPVHLQPAASLSLSSVTGSTAGSMSSGGAASPSSEVFRVLVELLLRQKGGRAYVVQQLEEMDGSQVTVPLQLTILQFLATALAAPQSYALHVPQMLEFYVHYHFLNFTRHYHKLPLVPSPAAVACCKGHMKVLLALCSHVSKANPVRRRFLQLKIMEFLIREVSLEHNIHNRQSLGFSASNSSTPQSTTRSQAAPSSARGLTAPSSSRSSAPNTAAGMSASRLGTAAMVAGAAATDESCASDNTHVQDGYQNEQPAQPTAAGEGQQQQQPSCAAIDLTASPAATAAGTTQQHGASCGKATNSSGKQVPLRSATPELYTVAGNRRPGITSFSRVAARQCRELGNASAAAGTMSRTSVKLVVRRFEAAAAAAVSPGKGARVQSAGRRLVLPPQTLVALSESSGGSSSSSTSKPQQQQQQQALQPRPPVVLGSTTSGAVLPHRGARVVPHLDVGGPYSSQGVCRPATAVMAGNTVSGQLQASSKMTIDSKPQTPVTAGPEHDSSRRSSNSEQASPRQDLNGVFPPSMLRKQHPKQPQLTGDTSIDDRLITEWEEQTGCEFAFDGLSDQDDMRSEAESDDVDGSTSGDIHLPHSNAPAGAAVQAQRTLEAPTGTAIPRLALQPPGIEQHTAAPAAVAAIDVGGGYRPGFDLEEDFERMMHAEEAGGPDSSHWPVSSSDSDSDDSSYIAAGRQDSGSDDSGPEGSGDHRTQHDRALELANTAAAGVVSLATSTAMANDGSGSDAGDVLCPQDDELEEQLLVSDTFRAHSGGMVANSASHRASARSSLVPHLNLPSDASATNRLQQHLSSASHSSNSSPALTPAARAQAPNLLDSATPLVTTRAPAANTANTGRPAADAHLLASDGQQQQSSLHGAMTPAAARHASAQSAAYDTHRHACAVYVDQELQVLCLELALHLLSTPAGPLDQLQLPQEPADGSLQHKVQVLIDHLSHPDNRQVVQLIAQRAESQQQTAAAPGKDTGWLADLVVAAGSATAGLASCTLRLLKLLSSSMMNSSQLQTGAVIQKGAFSEIYAGTLMRTSKPEAVAVKMLECGDDDSSCFERIYNEVAILESLQGQQGVVPLLEYGVRCHVSDSGHRQQPQWLLVFPRYSGSLRDWRCRRGQGLQQQDIELYLRVFLQVAVIVRDLHAANIVHYDIKGDNLLLDHSSDGSVADTCSSRRSSSRCGLPFRVVLADFGDALMVDGAAAVAERHRGTELFSSPEMLLLHAGQQHPEHFAYDRRKSHSVGRAHDVWSLGCSLYELLTGRTLFEEQGVGRITSFARSSSCAGAATPAAAGVKPAANEGRAQKQAGWNTPPGITRSSQQPAGGGVLDRNERAALCHHKGLVDLVEFMLVGDANWRPGAAEVVYKTQQLLLTCGHIKQ